MRRCLLAITLAALALGCGTARSDADALLELPLEDLQHQSRLGKPVVPTRPLRAKASEVPKNYRAAESMQVWMSPEDVPRGLRLE